MLGVRRLLGLVLAAIVAFLIFGASNKATNSALAASTTLSTKQQCAEISDVGDVNGQSCYQYVDAAFTTSINPAVIRAFDAWQEPNIMTEAWFQTAYSAGFRMFIVQDDTVLTPATDASTQTIVEAAEAAGLQVAAFTCSPEDYAEGISAFGGLPMAFFAFDVEPGNGPGGSNCNGSDSTIVPVTSAEVAAVQTDGIRPVIYSYPDGWQGGSGFTNIPLWASQDNTRITLKNWAPSLTSPPFNPTFGGWTQSDLMAMQNVWLLFNGVWIDLDSMSANY
jgi:hypothetical protein